MKSVSTVMHLAIIFFLIYHWMLNTNWHLFKIEDGGPSEILSTLYKMVSLHLAKLLSISLVHKSICKNSTYST